MRASAAGVLALACTAGIGPSAMGQPAATKTVVVVTGAGYDKYSLTSRPEPAMATAVVIGRVDGIEPDVVEVAPHHGAPKDRIIRYRVANVKVEDRLLGAAGLTRVRVAFVDESDSVIPPVRLSPGTEACFSLVRLPKAEFYTLATYPLPKSSERYAKEVDRMRRHGKVIEDPVAALKAKDLNDRFEAARVLLDYYLMPHGSEAREPVPDEETGLILALMRELPWVPRGPRFRDDGRMVPHRQVLWDKINPGEFGFKRPDLPRHRPGEPPADIFTPMEEATSKFLKENGDKIKLKRFVQK